MSTIVLRLPDVKLEMESRPARCKYCACEVLQRWGRYAKPVLDNRTAEVMVYRYRCTSCGRTFRHYPSGVSRADQTRRLEKLAALMWGLGLSLRGVEAILEAFGVGLSRTSVWRDGQQVSKGWSKVRRSGKVQVLGVDGAWLRRGGKRQGVMVAVDLGGEQAKPVDIAVIEEGDVAAVQAWLSELVRQLGVEVVVTDDLNSYKEITSELGVAQQICGFHARRWVGRRLAECSRKVGAKWQPLLAEVKEIMREMPPDGGQRLFRLQRSILAPPPGPGEKASTLYRLKKILLRLSDDWQRHRLFKTLRNVPSTNNGTERIIGRLKQRSHSVRGYKSTAGIESMFHLSTAIV